MKHDIQWADVGALKLAWQGFGDPNDQPLVMVMGLGMQLVAWPEELCTTLAQAGYYVIRFDNRDIGQSTWLDDLGTPNLKKAIGARLKGQHITSPYSLRDMADDLAGLIKTLKLSPVHLVGASMGGMIAQHVAIHYPELVQSLTSIMSTTNASSLPKPKPHIGAILLAPKATNREEFLNNAVFTWQLLNGKRFKAPPHHVKKLAGLAYDRGQNPPGFARHLNAILAEPSRTEALKNLKIPTLVLHGGDDPLVAVECGQHTADTIPNARFEVLPGMGHSMPPATWPILSAWIIEHCERYDPS